MPSPAVSNHPPVLRASAARVRCGGGAWLARQWRVTGAALVRRRRLDGASAARDWRVSGAFAAKTRQRLNFLNIRGVA